MGERFVGTLVIAMGIISAWVGIATATSHVRTAERTYRRTEILSAVMPGGWSSWFVGGFAHMTVGAQWIWATVALIGWTVAGLLLIGLGLQVFWRV